MWNINYNYCYIKNSVFSQKKIVGQQKTIPSFSAEQKRTENRKVFLNFSQERSISVFSSSLNLFNVKQFVTVQFMTPLNDTHGLSILLLHVLMLIHKPRSVISAQNYNNTRYLQYDYTKYRTRLIVIINVKYNVVLYIVDQEKYEINIILF